MGAPAGAGGSGGLNGVHLDAGPARAGASDPITYARHLLVGISRRQANFPELKGGDPDWAILLDLLVQASAGRSVCIRSACIASGAPTTTALRHVTGLIRRGTLIRCPDPKDARRTFVRLSPAAQVRLIACLRVEAALLHNLTLQPAQPCEAPRAAMRA